jgi:DNA-binding NarL/FixJ family response regulator
MGGQEAIAQLKAIDPDARAIVSSGYSLDPILTGYSKHGFSAAILKPYQISDLVAALDATLRNT